MKAFFISIFLLLSSSVFAQSTQERPQSTAAPLSAQRQRLLTNKTDADSWLSHYLLTERNKNLSAASKSDELKWTAQTAGTFVANSWQYQIITFIGSGKKDKAAVYKALALAENKALVLPYVVQYSIIASDAVSLKKYAQKLYALAPLSPNLYEYHYNTLMSAPQGATILARGIGDLVSLAMVQQAMQVRQDVTLRYYDANVSPMANSFFCLSLGKEEIEKYPNAQYSGLLIASTGNASIENFAAHFENDFKKSALKSGQLSAEEIPYYKNYLPSLILLYRYYLQRGNAKSAEVHSMILRIATAAGMQLNESQLKGQ